jgi:hypothetical protein
MDLGDLFSKEFLKGKNDRQALLQITAGLLVNLILIVFIAYGQG